MKVHVSARIAPLARPRPLRQEAMTQALAESAAFVREEARELILQSPGGPGRPPMSRSGALIDSLFSRAEGLGSVAGAAAPHAAMLELGTRERAARPFLLPAFLAARGRILRRIAAAAAALFRRSVR